MKKRLFEILILLVFMCSESHALTWRCEKVMDVLRNANTPEGDPKMFYYPSYNFVNPGFEIKQYYDSEKEDWLADRNEAGNMMVGRIVDESILDKVKWKDSLIKVNGINTKNKSLGEIDEIFENNIDKTVNLEIKRNKKIFNLELPIIDQWVESEKIIFALHSINKIDIKNSTFEIFAETTSEIDLKKGVEDLPFAQKAFDILVYKDENGEWAQDYCKIDLVEFEKSEVPYPGEIISIGGHTGFDKNKVDVTFKIRARAKVFDDFSDRITVQKIEKGTYNVMNTFNLETFPFDRQILKINIRADAYLDEFNFYFKSQTFKNLDFFVKNIAKTSIEGWDVKKYEINETVYEDAYGYGAQQEIEIYIERKHGYYIYKVLLPIILILMVCWSVVWIDPKELESRLTITIVCLLSLIAYNFVIDSELPKLEYMTVLDMIILISYFYATIPNFLSIVSFRLSKTNPKKSENIEHYSKLYGPTSYILMIFLIILFKVNGNLENTSAVVAWMGGGNQ
tara:strand:+ start:2481 stop:4010 length:1530 start_codon:yes stop_codon:yes gene_type:complete